MVELLKVTLVKNDKRKYFGISGYLESRHALEVLRRFLRIKFKSDKVLMDFCEK